MNPKYRHYEANLPRCV